MAMPNGEGNASPSKAFHDADKTYKGKGPTPLAHRTAAYDAVTNQNKGRNSARKKAAKKKPAAKKKSG